MVIKLLLRQWYKTTMQDNATKQYNQTMQQDNATRQLKRKKLENHSDNNFFSAP